MTLVTPDDDDAPMTFQAYATRIGTSRPYVSKLVATGIIHGDALVPDGRNQKIIPSKADAQRRAAADPARTTAASSPAPHADTPFTTERTRKLTADRELAELELAIRRGRYLERATAIPALAGFFRTIRDGVILAIRDNPDQAEDAVTDFFAAKAAELSNVLPADGAPPQPAS
jgi:hypothetical protein